MLDVNGNPIPGLTVEIWQCDAHQVYSTAATASRRLPSGIRTSRASGSFETSSKGEYYFRTIKPVPYPGRPGPHIHFKVKKGDRELLTTQLLVRGHPGNAQDNIFYGTRDPIDRELILTDFKPAKDSKAGEFGRLPGHQPGPHPG